MRSLLWITPKWPLPADDGARVASANLIRNLSKLGELIHLISCVAPEEAVSEEEARDVLGVEGCTVIRRESAKGTKLQKVVAIASSFARRPLVPVTMRFFAEDAVAEATTAAIKVATEEATRAGRAPVVVYDGLHTAAHAVSRGLFSPKSGTPPIVYRAHNREADLWSRRAALSSLTEKLFLMTQHKLVRRFEDSLVKRAVLTATVSDDDLACFRAAVPQALLLTVPIGFDFTSPLPFPELDDLHLAFLGRLDWHPNRDGLIWFLKEIWPELLRRRPGIRLSVAGSGDGSSLMELVKQPNISFLGRVDSVEDLFASAHLSIVPLFYGSGTRVKVITACALGRASLSTALGVEGVGLEEGRSYFRCETKEAWIETISTLSPKEAYESGLAAFSHARERFDNGITAAAFQGGIDRLLKNRGQAA